MNTKKTYPEIIKETWRIVLLSLVMGIGSIVFGKTGVLKGILPDSKIPVGNLSDIAEKNL